MKKKILNKNLIIIILVICITSLGISYALLSTNLIISGVATLDPVSFGVELTKIEQESLTGDAQIISTGLIDKTTISNLNVKFSLPGSSVMFKIEAENKGQLDLLLANIEMIVPECISNVQADAEVVCNYINLKLYDENKEEISNLNKNNTISIVNENILSSNTKKIMYLEIEYDQDAYNELSTTLTNVNNLGLIFTYVQSNGIENYTYGVRTNSNTKKIMNSWRELQYISNIIAQTNKTEEELVESDGAFTYNIKIGDKKDFKINDEIITAVVSGFNHDISNGETGITFIIENCLNETKKMYDGEYNSGGWNNSYLRNYLNGNNNDGGLYKQMTDVNGNDISDIIKSVTKYSDPGYSDENNNIELISTTDKLWLLSPKEVNISLNNYIYNNTKDKKYPLFNNNNLVKSNINWWLRYTFVYSNSQQTNENFLLITYEGSIFFAGANSNSIGIVFGFTI